MRHKTQEPTEWLTDSNGRRYRMIGDIKEYEMMIRVDGIEIPQGDLSAYHERKKNAEQAKKEAEKDRPTAAPRKCPFASGLATQCEQDSCALYLNGCVLAQFSNKAPKATEGMRCPFNPYHICRTDCALFNNNGCALTAISTEESEDN